MRKLFSSFAAIALLASCSVAATEELSLDCKAELTNGKRHYKLRIDVNSEGAAVTTEDDVRVYYTNKSDQTQWFRINQSTIEFGARFTTVRLETVIRRDTGMYLAYSGEFSEQLREKGFCRKSEPARRVF